jgi:hypothetical protein
MTRKIAVAWQGTESRRPRGEQGRPDQLFTRGGAQFAHGGQTYFRPQRRRCELVVASQAQRSPSLIAKYVEWLPSRDTPSASGFAGAPQNTA